ncbi:immune inhibitor A domain-containing protein [Paenactinomyces guangxiensis]|uniref:Immune inhibitor A n=1 Tax=Paenactinomyces guangxiensis TaxID=1490290 RepID=A0A7W1WTB6_9BACL|nr:immune inhibitor A domain-containing protein [Paenactinomyces guangxiensis]MBA4495696.1 immune inhibitor A [Paenactinomyces guangxiensis]MBH8592684.1 immune inhibitor A [Paenactinomyces guangxiensis]
MKINKSVIALLSTSLLIGAAVVTPGAGYAKSAPAAKVSESEVDWSVVNQEALVKSLIKKGKLSKDASPAEIEKAVKAYATRGKTPNAKTGGIDVSSKFGKRAYKGKKALQKRVAKKIAGLKESVPEAKGLKKRHVDNAVVALIEFPDYPHNNIKREDDSHFWVKDFNQKHYQNLLFNRNGFTMDDGTKLKTMTQYYLEQSAGYWALDGKVTPWIKAKNDAAYYGSHAGYANDARPRELVKETLESVGKQIAGNEAKFDQRDPYDFDNDGNVSEPDGLLDNLFIVHSGMGEEAGGGDLGENAIWSHRSVIGAEPVPIPGTTLKAFDYIIQPEDGASGVFCHEYGHNLGLPDEYDTGYTGSGSPVEAWSLMSYGSWTGKILGTEPTGFSPWAKLFFHETYGGNWPAPTVIDFEELHKKRKFKVKEAVADTKSGKMLKINLPDRLVDPPTQPLGSKSYFSTKGDMLNTKMISSEIDLTNAKTAKLTFDSWREIETDYDYLYVNIYADGATKPTPVKAYDDNTNKQWVTEEIDLSGFVGKKIKVEFQYVTDIALTMEGFYADNITVEADGNVVLKDDAEGTPKFTLDGFKVFDGSRISYPNYYLVEWRTHNGVDEGLAHLRRNNSYLPYDPGMLVWYYDGRFGEDNMTGVHPGEGFLGVVDAHQRGHYWDNGEVGTTRYQINDAAFGFEPTSPINVVYPEFSMKYDPLPGIKTFYDGNDYSSPFNPAGGKLLPKNGLKIELKKVNRDKTQAWIEVSKVKK